MALHKAQRYLDHLFMVLINVVLGVQNTKINHPCTSQLVLRII